MSVQPDPDDPALIRLEGPCPVEEAETLAALLLARPGARVDWTACTRLHTAVLQVLLRLRPPLRGPCGDPLVARFLDPGQSSPDEAARLDCGFT
ncbi:hypothetical protein M446_2048 [Methylobacterium sp. 4-46]|uniref:hypothetical protein n=1 Tax=unclassified Methylobacterium TaxID=2615210 RepID=UPI000152D3D6|nr:MULTISPECIES: hypothetical protein [Methylobacterium]ACA16511.1 hypothetical protein M446_2048 [Methylobacterium sp. 4-46]WFT82220.1 hypothetical protein QA634_10380 [Methylobacterium nodulans]